MSATRGQRESSRSLAMPESNSPPEHGHGATPKNTLQPVQVIAKCGGSQEPDLDYGLWAAIQAITASRRERANVCGAYNEAIRARDNAALELGERRKEMEQLNGKYKELFQHYKALHEKHKGLQSHYNQLCTDLTKAQRDRAELEAVRKDLEEQKTAVELELSLAHKELELIEGWASEDVCSRDKTIEKLREEIQDKDARLAHQEGQLESLERQKKEVLGVVEGHKARLTEIARLKDVVKTYELSMDTLQDEVAVLISENDSATRDIQDLKAV